MYLLLVTPVHAQMVSDQQEGRQAFSLQGGRDTGHIIGELREMHQWQHLYPDSALVRCLRIFRESELMKFPEGINGALQHLGTLYAGKGMYTQSMALFRQAETVCRSTPSLWTCLPIIYNGIATIYETQGHYRQAAAYYYKAVYLGERLFMKPFGGVYNNLGAVLISLEQYNESLFYLKKAEQASRLGGSFNTLGNVLNNKGLVYLTRRDWVQSRDAFLSALDVARSNKLPEVEYMAMTNMGIWHLWQQQPAEALAWLLQEPQVRDEIAPHYRAGRMENLGKIYEALGDLKQAEACYVQALDLSQELHVQKKEMELHSLLAGIYESRGDHKRALAHQKAYTALRDQISGERVVADVQDIHVKYQTSEKDRELISKQLLITRQKVHLQQKNLWIGGIATGTVMLAGIVVFIYLGSRQKQRLDAKRIHILEQEQQIGRLKAIMQGEEQERIRIARDLHDGIGGMLAAVKMNFTALQHQYEQYAPVYPFVRMEDFREIRNMIDETGREVRETAHNLMPDILVRHGLHEALKMYCDHINTGNQLYVHLQVNGSLQDLHVSFALSLYRVLQELVQNILKHSDASNALIEISRSDEQLRVLVKDNGKGFDTGTGAGGLGLHNLESRVHALQGNISVQSVPGAGTRVVIDFELQKVNSFHHHEYTDRNS